jgi:hypothetical protein
VSEHSESHQSTYAGTNEAQVHGSLKAAILGTPGRERLSSIWKRFPPS